MSVAAASWTSSISRRCRRERNDVPRTDDRCPEAPPLGREHGGGLHLHLRGGGGAVLRCPARPGEDARLPMRRLRPRLPPGPALLRGLLRRTHGVRRCPARGASRCLDRCASRPRRRPTLPPPGLGVRDVPRDPRRSRPSPSGPPRPLALVFGGPAETPGPS